MAEVEGRALPPEVRGGHPRRHSLDSPLLRSERAAHSWYPCALDLPAGPADPLYYLAKPRCIRAYDWDMWSGLSKYADVGLLIIRIGLGFCFVRYGLGKFMAGAPVLTAVGSVVGNLGITQGHYLFGILAASSEIIGGLLLLTGAFFRPACLLLLFIMIMAMTSHIARGDGFNGYSHPLELFCVFLGLFLIGPGKLSVDKK